MNERADYTALSPERKRNCKNGPTRLAQAASLCSAPEITSKCRSWPSRQPFSTRTPHNRCTLSALRPPSLVATSSQIRGRLCKFTRAAKFRIQPRFHHTEGESTASLPKTLGEGRAGKIVTRPPREAPPI